MNHKIILLVWLFSPLALFSQYSSSPQLYTPAEERITAVDRREALLDHSFVSQVPFTSIGPSVFSGRVADVDVWEEDPTHFYVAYASGGLWKTGNNGQSFTPLFDHEMVMTIGDIAVDWDRDVIWVGTGEVNSSRSSYSGMGMFRSDDGGKTWIHKGLPESHHIGRVLLHPDDPNTLWVAVLGHLYSYNPERGVYKTTDGGTTWNRVLFVNDRTGAVDLILDPQDPDVLYAATWQRHRMAWDFVESGEGSGIYKSMDGGETWKILSDEKSGFPTGDGTGRIGLSASVQEGKTLVYAVIDNQNRRPEEEADAKEEGLTKDQLRGMTREAFLALEEDAIATYLKDNDFPEEYDASTVLKMVRKNEIKPIALVEYQEDANAMLFDTPVIGAEVYVSKNGGEKWKKTHDGYLDDVYYSYGYYFGQVRAASYNPEKLYIFGVPVLTSDDGGANWRSINGDNVHVDHHALWISTERKGHLILGNDGGINISYDDGENWIKCNTPPVGQFYHIAVDREKNYNVYGGLQDNGSWYGPHTYEPSNRWHGTGRYPYRSFVGGDGMQTAVDTRDNVTIYGGFQFGYYYRINKETGDRKRITPSHELGERPYRWNWQTPIHLSEHNQDILYMGGNKLFRSMNRGDDWEAISGDLTKGGKKGDVPYGTITAIHESPLKFGLLYAGTDDGLLHVSRDGGHYWKRLSDGLPQDMWISRVQASAHAEKRVYLSLNGYRWDHFGSYLYVSDDYGDNWNQIGTDLPPEPVNVIKEDPVNPDLLYVGTDHGAYLSLDRGNTFMALQKGLPNVSVHDIVVHPTENDLILGTHGRSLYLTDISHVQKLTDEVLTEPLFAFEIEEIQYRKNWGSKRYTWGEEIRQPDIDLVIFVQEAGKLKTTVKVKDHILKSWEEDVQKGLNYFTYHADITEEALPAYKKYLNRDKKEGAEKTVIKPGKNEIFYLHPGTYTLVFEKDGTSVEEQLVIRQDKE